MFNRLPNPPDPPQYLKFWVSDHPALNEYLQRQGVFLPELREAVKDIAMDLQDQGLTVNSHNVHEYLSTKRKYSKFSEVDNLLSNIRTILKRGDRDTEPLIPIAPQEFSFNTPTEVEFRNFTLTLDCKSPFIYRQVIAGKLSPVSGRFFYMADKLLWELSFVCLEPK